MKLTKTAICCLTAVWMCGCQMTANTTDSVAVEPVVNQVNEQPAPTLAEAQLLLEQEVADAVALEQTQPEAVLTAEQAALEPMPPTDLWDRMKEQMSLPIPANKRLQQQLDWYAKHPSYMSRVSQRAEPFLYLIVEAIEARGLPMELALLPIVESAFDPFAYSHGRASGMWQFVPGTGKRFGLEQNWWYDGRRDVLASTEAALDYLEYLNRYFDGDWLHALAAYNSGEGRVRSAIRNNKRAGKPTDFWNLSLPRETRDYVPKLLALSKLLKDADQYQFDWPSLPNYPVVTQVDVGSQIDLAMAADLAEIELKELHRLNPGFNRWATGPDGPHTLLLPIDSVDHFEMALAALKPEQRLNWVRHKVKSGESLSVIAKRYHSEVSLIKQMNQLNGSQIRAGQHLLIPVASAKLTDYTYSLNQRLARTQSKQRGDVRIDYVVKEGDSLWKIGQTYKVSSRQLAKWNGMAPTDPLKVGNKLVIWQGKPSSAKGTVRKINYRVRNGDSLARIAQKFSVSVNDLVRWNQLDVNRYLKPGQMLKLYVDVTRINA